VFTSTHIAPDNASNRYEPRGIDLSAEETHTTDESLKIGELNNSGKNFLASSLRFSNGTILHEFESFFRLTSGEVVPEIRLGFCVYGTNPENPLVVIHPALTGSPRLCRTLESSSVASDNETQGDGWWDNVVGPGKLFDTNRYTVMCVAHLGGAGHSSSAEELSDFTVSIADTVRLTAQVLRRYRVGEIAAVVGGSMGAHQALYWLNEEGISIKTLIDVCGSSPGCDSTAEFFAAQRDILKGIDPKSIAARITANCSDLRVISSAFDIILNHVVSGILALQSDEASARSDTLAIARQIGFLRFVAPDFFENKLKYYTNEEGGDQDRARARLTGWLNRQGREFQARFDARALESLCSMLASPAVMQASWIAQRLHETGITLRGLSVEGDCLWPAVGREEFYRAISENLSKEFCGLVRHFIVQDPVNGHDFFLSQAFHKSLAARELLTF
jgi:homoserine acetyltransferase